MESFGQELKELREKAGLSQNALAKKVGLNASYINRLESGEREPPRVETVVSLAEGMGVSGDEEDCLLIAAGHLPKAMSVVGAADPTLRLVAEVLADETLSVADREEFRLVVGAIGKRWHCRQPK